MKLDLSPSIFFWPEYGIKVSSIEAALEDFSHGDHIPRFDRQLDRALYEGIPAGHQEVIAAHVVFDTCPRHLRPELIARKVRCTIQDAMQLADALSILDADEKLSREIYRWARIKGVEATLSYLHKFLVAIAEVEAPGEDPESDGPPVMGFQDIPQIKDMTASQLRRELKNRGRSGYSRMCRREMEIKLTQMDQAESEPEYSSPETIEYHRLGDTGEEDWITRQPLWFQKLLETVKGCKAASELKVIGKRVFESNLTGDRASVFWTFYNIRKRYLEGRQINRTVASKFIQRIENVKNARELAGIGRSLFRLQKGEIEGPEFRDHEWKAIWASYKLAKEAFLKAAA